MNSINIYCINLDERQDRWKFIMEHFAEIPEINLIRYPAIKHEKNLIGKSMSHIKCINENLLILNKKNIIIIEDDCYIFNKKNFYENITNIINWLDNNYDWNIFNGNPNSRDYRETKYVNRKLHLLETHGASSNFIIYNNTEKIRNLISNYIFSEHEHEHEQECIDQYFNNNILCITQIPFISSQYNLSNNTTSVKIRKGEQILSKKCVMDIYCINLDERTDKWNFMKEEFSRIPEINLIRYSAVKNKIGWKGCAQSHLNCIKEVFKTEKFAIIIEDDCEINSKKTFFDNLKNIINWLYLEKINWTIFNGNPNNRKNYPIKNINEKLLLYETSGTTTNFMIYNNIPELNKILDEYEKELKEDLNSNLDPLYYSIDQYLAEKTTCITRIPFLTTQHISISDITNNESIVAIKIKRGARILIKDVEYQEQLKSVDIYCISIDENRWNVLKSQEESIPQLNLIKIPAINHDIKLIGQALNHIYCIENYLSTREYIIVMEDDCLIRCKKQFYDSIKIILNWLYINKNDWEIFNGNPTSQEYKDVTKYNDNLRLIMTFGCTTNFIIYNNIQSLFNKISEYKKLLEKYYDIRNNNLKTIENFKKELFQNNLISEKNIDESIQNLNDKLDSFFCLDQYFNRTIKCITKIPFLTTQNNDTSSSKIKRSENRLINMNIFV
jgi:GR25 family glycosyltransferase involved in LPS biosynthesis